MLKSADEIAREAIIANVRLLVDQLPADQQERLIGWFPSLPNEVIDEPDEVIHHIHGLLVRSIQSNERKQNAES